MITPRFVPIVSVTGLVSLALCGLLAWQVREAAEAEVLRDCERAVAVRDDGRAMWLYLLGSAADDESAEARARIEEFVVVLNEKLPPLECRDGNPVPIKDP